MKAFVIAFNRLHMMRQLCEQLTESGLEAVIIDNASTYPPLLLWYEMECPYEVIHMDKNYGHQVAWTQNLIGDDKYYIVTDHDLDLSGIPSDWVEVLKGGLIENEDVIKCGLSLRINDLPENEYTKEVIRWETKYWERPKRWDMWYVSEIDTTLAMYDRDRPFGHLPNDRFFSAVRSGEPYTAKHLPWYNTKESIEADPEEKYYQETVNTYWSGKFKELMP